MANFKYAVRNGDNVLGIMWEVSDNREIFVSFGETINLNHSLEIMDSNGNNIGEKDLIDLLSEILPR
jgi:hypothetical protein